MRRRTAGRTRARALAAALLLLLLQLQLLQLLQGLQGARGNLWGPMSGFNKKKHHGHGGDDDDDGERKGEEAGADGEHAGAAGGQHGESYFGVQIPDWRLNVKLRPAIGAHRPERNAVIAAALGYKALSTFQNFVTTLRKTGYKDDIVLAVSPAVIDTNIGRFLRDNHVVAYAVQMQCGGGGGGRQSVCALKDWFQNDADVDKVPAKTLQTVRYELYLYFAAQYAKPSRMPTSKSFAATGHALAPVSIPRMESVSPWVLFLDFRDTFFQTNPFSKLSDQYVDYDIAVFGEHYPNKRIGSCPFNSGWIKTCYGEAVFRRLREYNVLCSGSTLARADAAVLYLTRMLDEIDSVQCKQNGIDQGIHNYVVRTRQLEAARVRIFPQGTGVVNTVGAMHEQSRHQYKGSLQTFWKLRSPEGFVLQWDGTRSPVIHQWDRFRELQPLVARLAKGGADGENAAATTDGDGE